MCKGDDCSDCQRLREQMRTRNLLLWYILRSQGRRA